MTPPQHSIDATPTLVLPDDPAWDMDRVESELADLEPAEALAHPWGIYQRGESRYDLTARHTWKHGEGSAGDYLKGEPVKFSLRRIRLGNYAVVQDAFSRELQGTGPSAFLGIWLKAATFGVREITGSDDLAFTPGPSGVPERVLDRIFDHYGGLETIAKIGAAAWAISKPLNDAEKKR